MSKIFGRSIRMGIAAMFIAVVIPLAAGMGFEFAELDGNWRGIGTERNSPFDLMQKTTCRSKIHAKPSHMIVHMVCRGEAGLYRKVDLSLSRTGKKIIGDLNLVDKNLHSKAPAMVLKGSVSGRTSEDLAILTIKFSGLMPGVNVTFKHTSPSSFSLRMTSLGILMTKTNYTKVDSH